MMTELRIGNSDQELNELRVLVRKGYLFDLCNSKIIRDALRLKNSELKERSNAIYHLQKKKGGR